MVNGIFVESSDRPSLQLVLKLTTTVPVLRRFDTWSAIPHHLCVGNKISSRSMVRHMRITSAFANHDSTTGDILIIAEASGVRVSSKTFWPIKEMSLARDRKRSMPVLISKATNERDTIVSIRPITDRYAP